MNLFGVLSKRTAGGAIGIAFATILFASGARASPATSLEARIDALERSASNLDYVWTLVAASLVLLMQAGFLLQEAGLVRSKNAISVAQKNLLDFAVSVVVFAAVGFMLAFGKESFGFLFAFDANFFFLSELTPWEYAFFVFQVMFCGTAATIISGAVAERMKLSAYLLCTALTAGIIYPMFAHWAWGAALAENETAFLSNWGFVDFAGSTVVHSTGAWIALAACLIIGPRVGKFDENGKPVRIQGHNMVLASCGALLLLVGWIGFNGGSTTQANTDIAKIIANTVLAAGTGASAAYILCVWLDGGRVLPEKTITGMIGGLVAITAGCHALEPHGAIIIGAVGGAVAVFGNWWLERYLKIDDPIGAIGAHGFAGVAGTVGLALLAPLANLPAGSRYDQLVIQLSGVGINFVWGFGLGIVFFYGLSRIYSVRIGGSDEAQGLNCAEHGTLMGVGHVENALSDLVTGSADLDMRLPVKSGDEAERLTRLFNDLMDNIQAEEYSKIKEADARRSAEEAERLSALANSAFEAIIISIDGRIIDCNIAFEEMIGLSLSELEGRALISLFQEDENSQLSTHFAELRPPLLETALLDQAGTAIPIELRGREIVFRNQKTRVTAISDLRERKLADERIRYLANHDSLTGLPNRTVFQERLAQAVAKSKGTRTTTAVFLVDLDRFKDVNDLYGHPAGDTVIRTASERLHASVRKTDTVARLGGDEFAIIQSGILFRTHAEDLAHRVIAALAEPIDLGDGTSIRTGGSVGIALCPSHTEDADELVNKADTALYRAKDNGRNTYCFFEDGMDVALKIRRNTEAALERAIEEEQFELWFQPFVELKTGTVTGHEALLRWRSPDKGLIPPQDFIPIAEESGKIIRIGDWALRKSCEIAKANEAIKQVSVNVSPIQFRDKSFVEGVQNILKETGLEPNRLELEITENVLIQQDDVRALAMLRCLKEFGIRIALDDFGTGYSSLSYLSRFPFDKIKIDKSFVQKLSDGEGAAEIIQTIVRLGRTFDMQVIGEGVEQAEDVRFLQHEGCDAVQGYFFAKPAPLAELCLTNPSPFAEKLAAVREIEVDALVEKLAQAETALRKADQEAKANKVA